MTPVVSDGLETRIRAGFAESAELLVPLGCAILIIFALGEGAVQGRAGTAIDFLGTVGDAITIFHDATTG